MVVICYFFACQELAIIISKTPVFSAVILSLQCMTMSRVPLKPCSQKFQHASSLLHVTVDCSALAARLASHSFFLATPLSPPMQTETVDEPIEDESDEATPTDEGEGDDDEDAVVEDEEKEDKPKTKKVVCGWECVGGSVDSVGGGMCVLY